MKQKTFYFFSIFFLFSFLILNYCCAEEQITIQAYYPSLHGNFQEARAYRMKIGTTYSGGGIAVNNNNLIVEGQVAINTPNVNSAADDLSGIKPKLTVQGTVSATGFQMQQAGVAPNAILRAADANGNAHWVNRAPITCVIRRDLAHAGNDNSWVMCHANEMVTGGGAVQSSGNNNSDYPFVPGGGGGVVLPSDGDSALGGGWGCFNQNDGCIAFAVCCTF